MRLHLHDPSCDCSAHSAPRTPSTGLWASLLPALACAVCPACLSTYAKIFSTAGTGFGLSDDAHGLILAIAVGLFETRARDALGAS